MTPRSALFAAGRTNSAALELLKLNPTMITSKCASVEALAAFRGRDQPGMPRSLPMARSFPSSFILRSSGRTLAYCRRILTWKTACKWSTSSRSVRSVEGLLHSFTQNRSRADRPEPTSNPGRGAVGQRHVRERRIGTQMDLGGKDDILPTPCQPLGKQAVDAAAQARSIEEGDSVIQGSTDQLKRIRSRSALLQAKPAATSAAKAEDAANQARSAEANIIHLAVLRGCDLRSRRRGRLSPPERVAR